MRKSYIHIIRQLDEFATSFPGISTLLSLVQSVEKILEEIFAVEHTGLYLYIPSEKRLRLLYAKGFNEEEFLDADQTAMERHPGLVYRSKQMLYIPDTLLDDLHLTMSSKRSFEIRSRLYIPVMNGEDVVGTFGMVDSKPNAYDEDDFAILSFIFNMAGVLYGKILNQDLLNSANEQIINLSKLPAESPNPILRISGDKILLFANTASDPLLKYHGFSEGMTVDEDLRLPVDEVLRSGKPVEYEITDGKALYSALFTPVAGTGYVNLYCQDITKRKVLEDELQKMALIAKETGNSVVLSDSAGNIEWVNESFTQITGYTLDEAKGMAPGRLLHGEETDPITVAMINNALENKKPIEVDVVHYSKSHKKYWVKVQIQPVFDSTGQLEYFISIQKEITREKQTEQELIRTTSFQKAILNSSSIAIYSTDLNGVIQSFNPASCQMLGYEAEEVIGLKTPHLFHDEDEIRTLANEGQGKEFPDIHIFDFSEINEPQQFKTKSGEFTFIHKDGHKFPVSLTISALRTEDNQVSGFLAMAENITRLKEQYDALQIANLRFSLLISSMQAGVMVEDDQRRVVLANQAFCDLFSIPVSPELLIGMNCAEAAEASKVLFVNPEIFIRDIDNTLILRDPVTSFELQMNDGTSLERDFVPIEDMGKKNQGILWVYRNITQRKNNERDLLRQSRILSGTAEAMNSLLTIPDHDKAIQEALEAIGSATAADRVYIFENKNDKNTGEAIFSQRYEWVAKGITPQISNTKLQNIPYSHDFPGWYNRLSNGKTVVGLVKDLPPSERLFLEEQDIISIIAVPIFIKNELWGMVGFDDCTKGIQWSPTELSILTALAASIGGSISRRMIESELIESRQIAEYATKTKSDFLATMSHEIRTPMNGVIGMTSLLMQTPLTPAQRDYTETIRTSGDLLLNLINDILDFSKIESGKMVLEEHNFDLIMAVEDVLDLMAPEAYNKKIGIYFQIDQAIPQYIRGDLTRLRQVLVNLASNAIKFTSEGEVIISVKQADLRGRDATLEFSIKDTGLGIPAEKIDRLFKPFSQVDTSTTRKYGGTGLGLAICDKLVKLMKGQIWVQSEVNRGSEFLFTIKTLYPPSKDQPVNPNPDRKILVGKKVLIIDKNPSGYAILSSFLDNLGIETTQSGSQASGTNLIRHGKPFDLLIIDDNITDLDLHKLVSEIKKIKASADIPLLLVAYPDTNGNESDSELRFIARINKPLKHSQLVSCMSDVFSNPNATAIPQIIQPSHIDKLYEKYPLNILVAEDNAINQKLILSLFGMLGYSIHIAANGFEVIEALDRMKIDIVFMDIQMPEMDGFEATRQIISRWGSNRPLIVAMTANALISDKEKCLASGMDDYISKPLTILQVKTGMEKWAVLCHVSGDKA